MVQQFNFLTVCLVAALLANATMANDGSSAIANVNANDCIKDYQTCKWNEDCCSGYCTYYGKTTTTTTTTPRPPPPCKQNGKPCLHKDQCCSRKCFFRPTPGLGYCDD